MISVLWWLDHQLFCAPLFGIKKIAEFDTHEHPLSTLVGRVVQESRRLLGLPLLFGASSMVSPSV